MMSKSRLKISDFHIRPARLEDYEGVMAMSDGIYGGRDIIPSVYGDYLSDPNRVFYVATLDGKVAAFAGVRMCDNGETCEGEGARTDARLRGSGLYLYSAVRRAFLIEKVLPTWPNLKRMRIVTIGVEEMRKQPDFDMLPNALRVVRELLWDMPRHKFLKQLSLLNRGLWNVRLPLSEINRATKHDLRRIFLSNNTEKLFPDRVVVRDSQSFTVGSQYLSNIDLLLGDRLHAMYMTQSSMGPDSRITSISFGTGIESNVDRHRMRYCIDYYGIADCDVIKGHLYKHLQEIRICLERSALATVVVMHIFMPKLVYDVINAEELDPFVWQELGFGRPFEDDTATVVVEQCVVDSKVHPRELAKIKGKL